MVLGTLAATSAEQHGKQNHDNAEKYTDELGGCVWRQQAGRRGYRLDLHAQQGQYGGAGTDGYQRARPLTSIPVGEQIGKRGELVGATNSHHRVEQNRCQQKGAADAQIVGQEAKPRFSGHAHRGVHGPDARVDAKAKRVDQGVPDPAAGQRAFFGHPRNAEEQDQV